MTCTRCNKPAKPARHWFGYRAVTCKECSPELLTSRQGVLVAELKELDKQPTK